MLRDILVRQCYQIGYQTFRLLAGSNLKYFNIQLNHVPKKQARILGILSGGQDFR